MGMKSYYISSFGVIREVDLQERKARCFDTISLIEYQEPFKQTLDRISEISRKMNTKIAIKQLQELKLI